MDDLFRSASASIRSYFGNHLTGFWLLERDSNRLQSVVLDFPDRKGLLAEAGSTDLTETDYEKLRTRRSDIWSVDEIERLPTTIADTWRAESITSVAVAPLAIRSGPLGLLAIGSRKFAAFGQEDLDLPTQIGIQISLALDNALAYRRLNACLEEEAFTLNRKFARSTTSGHRWQERRSPQSARPGCGAGLTVQNPGWWRANCLGMKRARSPEPRVQETKTIVYLTDGNGGFTPSRQTQELQRRTSDNGTEVEKKTLVPDANGKWQLLEVTKKTIKEDGKNQTSEESISRPDL